MFNRKISVIGLGYVGLPLAVEFSSFCPVIGFDKSAKRIKELSSFFDRTGHYSSTELQGKDIHYTHDPSQLQKADFHIVAVPTPVNKNNEPDLTLLLEATKTLAGYLKKGDVVVFESTVYPGTTEDECIPLLETISNLRCGIDFGVGYSPERINPGDKEHRLKNTVKVISATNEGTLQVIKEVYERIIHAGLHVCSSIKVAEAAKVIENTQRDLNIALMNELAIIFQHLKIDTLEVLNAAGTKWNFLNFRPGLVGGHCIGVDPYYLTHKAKRLGYHPEVILAGRRINDNMGKYVARETIKQMICEGINIKGSTVAILGFTFKENCPDIRNTRVIDIINELRSYHINVVVHDPLANSDEALEGYGLTLEKWENINKVDTLVFAVGHDFYKTICPDEIKYKFTNKGLIIDVKGIINQKIQSDSIKLWRL